ncbi:MAG: HAD family phosphatase [Lachnospiraceae bacterium]|jgi:beta-phosphoglucomutase|nr:HAD family phosphatase [Lachnospiraceae bacterium]
MSTAYARGVIFDFNGTLFFDTIFHEEAWREIFIELHGETKEAPGDSFFRGPRNDTLIQAIAPKMTEEERRQCSVRKESIYRSICMKNPEQVHLAAGAEELFEDLTRKKIPFALATASILDNIDFYYREFPLEKWISRELCVYDDGNYMNKGEMHLEAARRIGVPLSECLVIEDSPKAIAHAKKNGAGIVIGIGEDAVHTNLLEAGVDYCIHDFTEFNLAWLKS